MFQLQNSKVEIAPEMLALPFFKVIWDKDKSKDKSKAYAELSYIFYLVDFKSPYSIYDTEKKRELIKREILKNVKYEESNEVKEAIQKYRELSTTPTMDLLESARGVIKKLKDYFDGVVFSEAEAIKLNKEEVDEPLDVLNAMEKLSKAVEAINKLEEKVKKEITEKSNVRGQKTLTAYSEPE